MLFFEKVISKHRFLWAGIVLIFFVSPNVSAEVNRKYSASQIKINTIIVDNYYPYTFVNKNGDPDGFSVDLIKAVAAVMGMELGINPGIWEQAKESLFDGGIDFLPMMAYSKERDKIFDFSVPHTIAYDAFFTRKNSSKISTMDDLKGKTVIVMKDDQAHDYLNLSGLVKPENLIFTKSIPEALRLLASGKGDAALMPKLVGLLVIKDLGLKNLVYAPAVIEAYNRPFSFSVKKGNQPLLERLNQGLRIVKETNQYNEIYEKWFGEIDPKEVSLKETLIYIIGVIGVFVIIAAILMFWSFSLRKQVAFRTRDLEFEIKERKDTEVALRESEEKFRNFAEQSLVGIYLIQDGFFKYVNPKFAGIFDYTVEECLDNMSFLKLVPPDDMATAEEQMRRRLSGEEKFPHYMFKGIKKGGEIVELEIFGSSILLNGNPVSTGAVLDITERKQTETALKDSERLLNEVGRIAKIGGWEMDLTTRKAKWTKGTYDIVEIEYDQPVPGPDEHIGYYLPEYRSLVSDSMQALVEEDRPLDFEAPLRTAKGNIKWCCAFGRAIKKEGRCIKVYGTFQDITDRKKAEEEIRELNRNLELRVHQRTVQLKEANKELEDFVYSVSHDLRAPLRSVSGFAEIIDRRHKASLNEEGRHYFDNIVRASKQMGDLIDDLLKFSRLGRKAIKPEAISLDDVFKTAIETLGHQIREKGAQINLPDQMPVIQGDLTLATNIFINLLENAIKYHKPNEPALIDVSFDIQDPYVVVSIADNGIGIAPEFHEKIFNIFQRLHSQADYPGTGIGLAAVKKAVQIMGGQVWVESETGKGSVFKIKVLKATTA